MERREITTKRVEFSVPLTQGFGTTHAEIAKAVQLASQEYFQTTGGQPGDRLPDDAIRLDQGENEIIVFFELRREA